MRQARQVGLTPETSAVGFSLPCPQNSVKIRLDSKR